MKVGSSYTGELSSGLIAFAVDIGRVVVPHSRCARVLRLVAIYAAR